MATRNQGWGLGAGAWQDFTPYSLILLCLALGIGAGAAVAWVNPIIVIAGVLGLVVGVVLLQHLQWSLWAVIAVLTLLPFGAVRLGIGFNPTFLNLTLVALLAAWAMDSFGRRLHPTPNPSPSKGGAAEATATPPPLIGKGDGGLGSGWRGSAIWLPTLLYLSIAILGFVLGSANATPGRDLIRRFAEFLLAVSLVWLLPNILRQRHQLLNATRAVLLGGGLAAILGLTLYIIPDAVAMRLLSMLRVFDYPAGPGVLRYINDDPGLAQRATGTSVDPNAFGGLLIVIAAMTIPHLFARRPLLPTRMAWLLFGSLILAIFATHSRGSMLGVLAAAGLIALLRYRRLFVWLVVGVALILVLPWTQDYVANFYAGVRGQDLSTQMRLGEYKDALTLISRHPWFGVGYAATPDIDLYIGVSSLYLLMAENIGLIGLSSFLLVMARFFFVARGGLRTGDEELGPIILGGVAAMFGVLVAGVFDHYYANIKFPASVTMFWLIIALITTASQMATSRLQTDMSD